MTDPNWLLATMAQSAAAMVAVIGGFLVSRIITLTVERQSLDRRSRELQATTAEVDAALGEARERRQALSWAWFIDVAATPCAQAWGKMPDAELAAKYPIRGVSESEKLEMASKLNQKMREAIDDIAATDTPTEHVKIPRGQGSIYQAALSLLEVNWYLGGQRFSEFDRYDRLILEENRLATELAVLKREQSFYEWEFRVTRPKGLGLGVGVLGYLTVVGVVAPVIGLAMRPVPSSPTSRLVLVALFVSGLVVLFGYLIYAVRQLRRDRTPR